ncbi:efflux transporter outer membrane subunit [Ramlibacter sp. USB13]|uniref:Efflux transporter outer membrane subunit n=1 Tax=Ramlibacter cellulosilyticus TaxID=2764187 RepID=A0A923SED2_9BURK|nr:efflux transporter outer membrane subunit [Ramlibacter cellulosilyticus]MBC5782817.1 efflux transporter outer membrane subunit [Ramlibacter cellulosilyticus]
MKLLRPLAAAAGVLSLLAGCALPRPPSTTASPAPPRWYAPLPHGGTQADLRQWWRRFDDPLLADLVEAAQAASPDVATAGARIAEARSARVAAGAATLPAVDASVSAVRGNAQSGVPALSTVVQNSVQVSWEADLFGGLGSRVDAATSRLAGAEAGWHEARVAVAAETATTYVDLRTCTGLVAVTRNDAASRAETARLTRLSADAGFTAPAVAAQARASAAEGAVRVTQQQAQCDLLVKGLVALTGMAEPELRRRLAAPWEEPAGIGRVAVPSVPAALLAQRPDIYAAEREVAAASADVGAARADRFPRLTLTGQINNGWIRVNGQTSNARTWAIGPLAVTLPLFDGGRLAAAEDAAAARYEEAALLYAARVRLAVREVEEALVNLDSAISRSEDVRTAYEGYRASFLAAEARYRSGLGSLIEMEDQRRLALGAELALANVQRDRLAAWIALYRALGGGWERPEPPLAQQ